MQVTVILLQDNVHVVLVIMVLIVQVSTYFKFEFKVMILYKLLTNFHRQENRRLVGHFYDMKNRFWAVGCGLGWAVE